jgi:hypothetical protein
MVNRRFVLSTCSAAIVGLLGAVSVHGGETTAARTTYLTVNVPVALPGVALAPGTYIFELAAPGERLDVVRVSSRDRSQVYYTGFTELVIRPAGLREDRLLSFGESLVGAPRPVTVWYPTNDSTGRRFIYPRMSRQLIGGASN